MAPKLDHPRIPHDAWFSWSGFALRVSTSKSGALRKVQRCKGINMSACARHVKRLRMTITYFAAEPTQFSSQQGFRSALGFCHRLALWKSFLGIRLTSAALRALLLRNTQPELWPSAFTLGWCWSLESHDPSHPHHYAWPSFPSRSAPALPSPLSRTLLVLLGVALG